MRERESERAREKRESERERVSKQERESERAPSVVCTLSLCLVSSEMLPLGDSRVGVGGVTVISGGNLVTVEGMKSFGMLTGMRERMRLGSDSLDRSLPPYSCWSGEKEESTGIVSKMDPRNLNTAFSIASAFSLSKIHTNVSMHVLIFYLKCNSQSLNFLWAG